MLAVLGGSTTLHVSVGRVALIEIRPPSNARWAHASESLSGKPKTPRIISVILVPNEPRLMDLGSGPLESFSPLPAGELVRSLCMLFGMALPICSTYSQPAVTAEYLQ